MSAVALGKHPCPNCGGDAEFHPARQALVCPYCGTVSPWTAAEVAAPGQIIEHPLDEGLALYQDQSGGARVTQTEVKCQSCHAISVFVETKVAQRCDFCGSPSVVAYESVDAVIRPESLLPFQYTESQVRESMRRWYGTRWFAPNKLKSAALTDRLHGIYLPYWTFDAKVWASWRAESGTRHGSGKKRRTSWRWVSGQVTQFYDDLLVPASLGVHPKLLRGIEPFPTDELRVYEPEFVRGWTVERYQVDLPEASRQNLDQMQKLIRSECAAQVPGDTYRNLTVDARYENRTFKHCLFPVWLVSYQFGRRTYQVAVNGYTGKIRGEQPISWWKVFFYIILPAMVLLYLLFGTEEGRATLSVALSAS